MATYLVDPPGPTRAQPWDPAAPPLPRLSDMRYFGAAMTAMEAELACDELTIVLTWDIDALPVYGDQVVAIVLGDEASRIPRYCGDVGAVFKSYGHRPATGALRIDRLGFATLVQGGYRWLRWLPGAVHNRQERRAPMPFRIPVGTYNQLALPIVPMQARGTDLFFAGSVTHGAPRRDWISAKEIARSQMLDAVAQLGRAHPDLRIAIKPTSDFTTSAEAAAESYSGALMDARVCLAPRGTSLETFRVLEGLRCGCIVVAESLPATWFYDGAPILRVTRWRELPDVLMPVLASAAATAAIHRRALVWWHQRCSEAALGRYLARTLQHLGLARRSA